MKFELDDTTVLKVSSLAAGSFAVHSWAAPDHFQTFYHEKDAPKSDHQTRWFGLGLASYTVNAMAVAVTDDASVKTKKNVLKASGACWALGAAQNLVNVENGITKKELGYGLAAGQAVLAALCLWRGFKEDDKTD